MSGRRGFLALVGGAVLTGPTTRQWGISRPTLVFPQTPTLAPSPSVGLIEPGNPTGYPLLDAVLARGESQMHAFIHVKGGLPDEVFFDWLEGGLRMVEGCKPGGSIYRTMQVDLEAGLDPWRK